MARRPGRIRDEVHEEADSLERGANPDSAAAHLARTGRRKHGPLIGMLLRIAGDVADSSIKDFGERHGMEPAGAAEFHASHIHLPLPGTASDVLAGPLPGSDRAGELAWLEFSSLADMQRNYRAVVVDCGRELPTAWVDADDVTVPGFDQGFRRGRWSWRGLEGSGSRSRARPPALTSRSRTARAAGSGGPRSRRWCRGHWRSWTRRADCARSLVLSPILPRSGTNWRQNAEGLG